MNAQPCFSFQRLKLENFKAQLFIFCGAPGIMFGKADTAGFLPLPLGEQLQPGFPTLYSAKWIWWGFPPLHLGMWIQRGFLPLPLRERIQRGFPALHWESGYNGFPPLHLGKWIQQGFPALHLRMWIVLILGCFNGGFIRSRVLS